MQTNVTIQPDNVVRSPSSEYYSSVPGARVLVRINIWGAVKQPGTHFVPLGASLVESIGAAGGPLDSASFPNVRLVRDAKPQFIDVLSDEGKQPIHENDVLYVEKSMKAEMPLILTTISTIVSVVTLYLLIKRND